MLDEFDEVVGGRVDGDHEAALGVFAQDGVGPVGLADVGDVLEGDALAALGVDVEVGEAFGILPPFEREADHEVVDALALVDLGHGLAADQGGEFLVEVAGSDAVGEGPLAVDLDAELRDRRPVARRGLPRGRGSRGRWSAISVPRRRSSPRSGPKIFTATLAETPLSMWPIRSASGPLMALKVPGMVSHRGADVVDDFLAGAAASLSNSTSNSTWRPGRRGRRVRRGRRGGRRFSPPGIVSRRSAAA